MPFKGQKVIHRQARIGSFWEHIAGFIGSFWEHITFCVVVYGV